MPRRGTASCWQGFRPVSSCSLKPTRPLHSSTYSSRRPQSLDQLGELKGDLVPDGVIWVSWPKKASGVKTDVTEDTIRAVALPLGLVDVKVCAVDDIWSALKLVIRVANRKK